MHAPDPQSQSSSYVTAEQFAAMEDKWAEQFACFEALLTKGIVFSTPKTTVKPVTSHIVLSDSPFIAPTARPTGLVEIPPGQEAKP